MLADQMTDPISDGISAEWLNKECACVSTEEAALRSALEGDLGDQELSELVAERCPHLFAALPVFVSRRQAGKMAAAVSAVQTVVSLPSYQHRVLAGAPPIARHVPAGATSVFFGYDFHVGPSGVALIEINTNAGGAMLNAALARAQRACCEAVESLLPALGRGDGAEWHIVDMFRSEWTAARGARPLRTIAIVDEAPAQQYLYPEFLMFRRLFERSGIRAVIADPSELAFRDGALRLGDTVVDLVYNRSTDFAFDQPSSAALRAAYLADATVITPHPRAHALYADKRNLALLSDAGQLQALGVPSDVQRVLLETIPRTEIVTEENAQLLWSDRRKLFFKPVAGFGGRAAYRGDKLTRRAWLDILDGDYVAQAIVMPGERTLAGDAEAAPLKFDVRNYVYDGSVQSLAARLYQGQTTNFRTPGGGFAPVYQWPD